MLSLHDKLEGSLRGVVVGDALGLPVEVQTRDSIRKILGGASLINEIRRIGGNGFYKSALLGKSKHADHRMRLGELGITEESIGICSDDTLLTAALARSIGKTWSLNMDDIIEEHLAAYISEPFGFGAGTRTVLERIRQGEDWSKIQESSFGNGIAMKQAPIAWYFALRVEQDELLSDDGKKLMDEKMLQISSITHNHPVANTAALIQNRLLVELILSKEKEFDLKLWIENNLDGIEAIERSLSKNTSGRLLFSELMQDLVEDGDTPLSLEEIYSRYVRPIAEENRPQFNILSTMGIVYAIFMRKQDYAGLQEAASIGGDTDSYAATIGGMIGAVKGPFYPEYIWSEIQPRYRKMIDGGIMKMQEMIGGVDN